MGECNIILVQSHFSCVYAEFDVVKDVLFELMYPCVWRLYSLVCVLLHFVTEFTLLPACVPVTFPLLPLLNFSIACQTNVEDLNAF